MNLKKLVYTGIDETIEKAENIDFRIDRMIPEFAGYIKKNVNSCLQN